MKYILKAEADWLAIRKNYITASEAAALVGADPYSSPSKIRNPEPFSGNAYTLVGQMLEPVVVQTTNQKLGTKFELFETADGTKEFYTDDYFGATPDAHENRQILLECKTVNAKSYLKYSVVPPSKYIIQLIVQSICTGLDKTDHYISLLNTKMTAISQYEQFLKQPNLKQNWDISVFKILHNPELCNILKEQAKKFKEQKTFKVDSKVKQKVKLLLTLCYERVL